MLNVTVATIVSPRSKASPTGGEPIASAVTPAAPWLPSTLWAAAFVITCVPKPLLVAVLPSRASEIVAPDSVSARAGRPIPSESESDACTA